MLGTLAAALLLVPACGKTVVYDQDDYTVTHQQSVLMLEPTYLPPAPEPLQRQVAARMEAFLMESPHLGRVLTREAFRAENNNRRIQSAYDLLSDTVSVLGMGERELSATLAGSEGTRLGATAQLFYMPCDFCEEGDQISVVGQIHDLEKAQLLLRAHVIRSVSGPPEALGAVVEEMTGELLDEIAWALSPKPHRQRYENRGRISGSGQTP